MMTGDELERLEREFTRLLHTALAGTAAAILIALIAGCVLMSPPPDTADRFAVQSTTRIDSSVKEW